MFKDLVAELQFELDRHNLRVRVAQARKAQLDEMAYLQHLKEMEEKSWCVSDIISNCDCTRCKGGE